MRRCLLSKKVFFQALMSLAAPEVFIKELYTNTLFRVSRDLEIEVTLVFR